MNNDKDIRRQFQPVLFRPSLFGVENVSSKKELGNQLNGYKARKHMQLLNICRETYPIANGDKFISSEKVA